MLLPFLKKGVVVDLRCKDSLVQVYKTVISERSCEGFVFLGPIVFGQNIITKLLLILDHEAVVIIV